jgi:adenine-specific DNA-methyltransferase
MAKDYSKLSREELVEKVKELEKAKKYGLVWEEKTEDVVKQCQKELPVLIEVKGKEIVTDKDKPTNILIEGDNYHALSVLNYTHAGKIDVIYIDPPYNTGNKDFIFNDRFVDQEDSYRHSKWLSFMKKRLELAENLLRSNGLLYISIDDNEFSQLKMLCDKIFGEKNFINIIALRVSPPNGVKTTHAKKTIIKEKEYLVVYAKNKNKVEFFPQFKKADKWDSHFDKFIVKNSNDVSKWKVIPLKDKLQELNLKADLSNLNFLNWIRKNSDEIFQSVGLAKIKGIDKYNTDNFVQIDGSTNYLAYKGRQVQLLSNSLKKTDEGETLSRLLCDLWTDISFNNLFQEGGVDFRFGKKPTSLIRRIVKLSSNSLTATVLDFFAGSGTTGHAVLELNKEDNSNRKFILCTNDEGGICTKICYPRLKNAIKGYKNKKALGGNLKYFKTDFVPKTAISDDTKYKLVNRSTEMICLREDTFDKVLDKKYIKIFENKNQYTAILFHLDQFEQFKEELQSLKKRIHIYVFSLTNDTYDDDFKDLKQKHDLCPIPESILEVYRKIFKE